MSKKRTEKPKLLQRLEKSIAEILVTRDHNLKPFIHSFHHEPENISHQPLGVLLGVFEIEDRSKDSAYIVNFLASVAKKEYFSHPKRPAIESLEAALHKVNLALSELIKHDNTAWLGKLNAAVCVLEKHNLHFSVAGQARTLLIRNNLLTDISDGLVEEYDDPHPLKTFTEVASGRLKAEDQILITTPDILDILSPEEIQRNAQRFSQEQFLQFLRTASLNKLAIGGTIVIHVFEYTEQILPEVKPSRKRQTPAVLNAFSQTAFDQRPRVTPPAPTVAITPSPATGNDDIPDTESEPSGEYTDSKTGHIYVQGETTESKKENERWKYIQLFLEEQTGRLVESVAKAGAKYRRTLYQSLKKQVQNAGVAAVRLSSAAKPAIANASKQFSSGTARVARSVSSVAHKSWSRVAQKAATSRKQQIPIEPTPPRHIPVTVEKEVPNSLSTYIPAAPQIASRPSVAIPPHYVFTSRLQNAFRLVIASTQNLAPHISRITTLFRSLTPKHRRMALGILGSIVVVPALILWIQDDPEPVTVTQPATTTETAAPEPPSNAIQTIRTIVSLARHDHSIKTLLLDGRPFLVTRETIVDLSDPAKPRTDMLPEGSVAAAASMDDLNALFLLNNNGKLFSFTPSNRVFTQNDIAITHPSAISDLSAYLTYLYVTDTTDGTIYRYPRSEKGFGSAQKWLKSPINIDRSASLAINENLYLNNPSGIQAFYQGKPVKFTLPPELNPITITSIFTAPDAANIYILDAEHKKIAVVTKAGELVKQYTHINLEKAISLAANEETKTIYFTTPSETFSFSME